MPHDKFGESLADEHKQAGAYVGPGDKALGAPGALPNAGVKTYGGAQYSRTLREFCMAVGTIQCPKIEAEQIVSTCGMANVGDNPNFVEAASRIALHKAQNIFEPLIERVRMGR